MNDIDQMRADLELMEARAASVHDPLLHVVLSMSQHLVVLQEQIDRLTARVERLET